MVEWVPFPSPGNLTNPGIKPASPAWQVDSLPSWLQKACGSVVRNPHATQKLQKMGVQSLVWKDPVEESMTTHSSILACRMPWTEEPMDSTVHRVTKSWTWLKWLHTREDLSSRYEFHNFKLFKSCISTLKQCFSNYLCQRIGLFIYLFFLE